MTSVSALAARGVCPTARTAGLSAPPASTSMTSCALTPPEPGSPLAKRYFPNSSSATEPISPNWPLL